MSVDVRVVAVTAASASLRAVLIGLRGSDPLAPVTVIVPSALAGATLRRGLFPGGLAGVRFTSLPQYVDGVLTAAKVSSARRAGAHRRALVAQALSGSRWEAPHTTGTLRLWDALLAELDEADVDTDLGEPDVLVVHRAYRALLSEAERILPADRAAAALPPEGAPVVLHLPRRLTAAELRFCHALGSRLSVVLAVTGDEDADTDTQRLITAFGGASDSPVAPLAAVELSVDSDAEEEARQSVRTVLEHLGDPSHRADRVAIVYRSAVPYARLVHEQLTAAGLPHHIPRQRTIAQTVSGRALLGYLSLPDNGFSRPDLTAWWACAPLRAASGQYISASRWDRLSRDAGATRGQLVWTRRLSTALSAAKAGLDTANEVHRARHQRRVDHLSLLGTEMAALFIEHDALASAASWADVSTLCLQGITRHLGSSTDVTRWKVDDEDRARAELAAYEAVTQAVRGLGDLDDSLAYPGFDGFRQVLSAELDRPVRESSGLARGVIVAPMSDLVGADLDLLVVLGMSEGAFPPRAREHPLLRDEARLLSNGALRTTADRRRAERRDFLHVISASPKVVLSYPAADLRTRRATHPSPWYLEHGNAPDASSFVSRLRSTTAPATSSERDVQLLLTQSIPARDTDALPAVIPALALGLQAVAARSSAELGPWTGRVTPEPGADVVISASGLQNYATCPHQYFLSKVLKVRDRDEPDDEVSPLDIGLVVHDTLESFFSQHYSRSPDDEWTADEHQQAHTLLDECAAKLAAEGKAGRPLVWANRVRQMHRSLRRTLMADDAYRRERRAVPHQTELGFGLEGGDQPAVEVNLPSGRTVSLRGSIDRVDVRADGGLTVLDWKTGSLEKYKAMNGGEPDLVDGGRHLQLPLYAEAARAWHGQPADVEAFYVFVDHGATRVGGNVDSVQEARFTRALDVLTGGVAEGVFPMNPGVDGFFGWSHCGFCAFDRLCPSSRGVQWEGVRDDSALADYRDLTEADGAPS